MTPGEIEGFTDELGPPKGMSDCDPLKVIRCEDGFVSKWDMTDEEVADIVKTKSVYLVVFGRTHPPVSIGTRRTT